MIYQPIEYTGEYTTGTIYSEEYVKKLEQEIERLNNKLKLITKIIENEKVSITMLIGGVGIVDKKQDFLNLLGSDK